MLRALDRFIAVSQQVATRAYEHIPRGSVTVIPNFVDPTDFRGPKEEFVRSKNIVYVGLLGAHKGVHILVESFEKMRNKDMTTLEIVGIPDPAFSVTWGSRTLVLLNLPREEVIEHVRKAYAVVIPSLGAEAFGLVALEAMACAKPVVASRVGALREIIVDGETGILVPPNDVLALSSALDYLVENPRQAREMGEKGYDRVMGHYSADLVVPRMLRLYAELCG